MDKILVTYASRTGSTSGVAEAIGQTLTKGGMNVDVLPMLEVTTLSSYSAVVAGSAIQSAQWLPEAIQFIKSHQNDLKMKPFAIFTVCMTLAMSNGEKYRQGIMEWVEPIRRLVSPISEGHFAGTLDISKISSFGNRLRFRLSVLLGVWKEGDHRNWDEIRLWAENLKQKLK